MQGGLLMGLLVPLGYSQASVSNVDFNTRCLFSVSVALVGEAL
jgi:hypothetical protein